MQALAGGYTARPVHCRSDRRRHRRPRGVAAGDGVRDRVGPHAASRHLLRDHHRLPDFGARRIALPDRRTDRRVRGGGLRHRRQYGIDGLFMCTLMAGVMLVIMGLTGTGTAVKYIPRPVDDRVHQRHRAGDHQHAVARFPRPGRSRSPVSSSAASRRSAQISGGVCRQCGARRRQPAAADCVEPVCEARAGVYRGAVCRHHRRGRAGTRRRYDRIAVWRHSFGPAGVQDPRVPSGAGADAVIAGGDGGHARRDRIAVVGRGRGSHGRRSSQSQHRAVCARRGEYRVAVVWRVAGHRRARAHGHEHPLGRAHAGRRDRPCADAARRADVGGALRRLRAAAGAGRDPVSGRVEHGRVARDRRNLQAHLRRHPGLARSRSG